MAESTRKVDGGRIPGSYALPNVVHVRMLFQLTNGKIASVGTYGLHEGSYVASDAQANELFIAISNAWKTRLATYLNATVSFQALTVRDMSDVSNPEFRSTQAAVPSTGLSAAMPQDVAIVLTAVTAERGRGARGRLYLPGWGTAAANTNGQIASACVTAVTAFGTDLRTALNAEALTSAVARPPRQEYTGLDGAVHPARAGRADQVISYVCQNTEFDSQRRRGL